MRGIAGLIAIALMSGCAAPRPPEASEQEKLVIQKQWVSCMVAATRRLDDYTSPASAVGSAVANSCWSEMRAASEVYSRHQNMQVQLLLADKIAANAPARATEIVLMERRRILEEAPAKPMAPTKPMPKT